MLQGQAVAAAEENKAGKTAHELAKTKRRCDELNAQVTALKGRIEELKRMRMRGTTDGDEQEDVEATLAQKNQELKELKEALAEKDNEIERLKTAIRTLVTK